MVTRDRPGCFARLGAGLLLAVGSAFAAAAPPACDGRFAGDTLRWIVPSTPGGGYDAYSRLIEPHLERTLGAEITVFNEPAAGGIVGAGLIRDARPDGRTLGLINAPGLMVAALTGESRAPHPLTDFTVLARVAASRQIWAAASASPVTDMQTLLRLAGDGRLVFDTRDVGSLGFVAIVVAADLLGFEPKVITGYRGSSERGLAALRGEVDAISTDFESLLPRIDEGDLRPLLQISAEPVADHPALQGIPLLAGPDGQAAMQARAAGGDPAAAAGAAAALTALTGAGRLVVTSPSVEPVIAECLAGALLVTLQSPELRAAAATAQRTLDVADAATTRAELELAARNAERFIAVIQAAVRRLEQ